MSRIELKTLWQMENFLFLPQRFQMTPVADVSLSECSGSGKGLKVEVLSIDLLSK